MIGIISSTKDAKQKVKSEDIFFVSIPDDLPPDDIKIRFSRLAQCYANQKDVNRVYLIYGKDDFIEYDYKI